MHYGYDTIADINTLQHSKKLNLNNISDEFLQEISNFRQQNTEICLDKNNDGSKFDNFYKNRGQKSASDPLVPRVTHPNFLQAKKLETREAVEKSLNETLNFNNSITTQVNFLSPTSTKSEQKSLPKSASSVSPASNHFLENSIRDSKIYQPEYLGLDEDELKYRRWLDLCDRATLALNRRILDFDQNNNPKFSKSTKASTYKFKDPIAAAKKPQLNERLVKSVDFLNPPNPKNLSDPRIIDYTVNERLFPEPVLGYNFGDLYANRKEIDDHFKVSNQINANAQVNQNLHPDSPKKVSQYAAKDTDTKYIRLNFPRHRINHESCSVVRNNKPSILIRNQADLACSYSLLANSNNSVKNAGANFKIFKPKNFAPKNKNALDLNAAFRENVYTKMNNVNLEADKLIQALNDSEYALREKNFYQKSIDAKEWIDRSRHDNLEKDLELSSSPYLVKRTQSDLGMVNLASAEASSRKNGGQMEPILKKPLYFRKSETDVAMGNKKALHRKIQFMKEISPRKVVMASNDSAVEVDSVETEYFVDETSDGESIFTISRSLVWAVVLRIIAVEWPFRRTAKIADPLIIQKILSGDFFKQIYLIQNTYNVNYRVSSFKYTIKISSIFDINFDLYFYRSRQIPL